MTTVHDLATFIRTRLDEDEQAARSAFPGPWRYNPRKVWHSPIGSSDQRVGEEFVGAGPSDATVCVAATGPADNPQSMADAAHIARHDPARVLREVAAKRKLLAYLTEEIVDCTCEAYGHHEDTGLRLLGACWADHPDYQPRWAPAAA